MDVCRPTRLPDFQTLSARPWRHGDEPIPERADRPMAGFPDALASSMRQDTVPAEWWSLPLPQDAVTKHDIVLPQHARQPVWAIICVGEDYAVTD